MTTYKVTYQGFTMKVVKRFDTKEQAEHWAKQIGVMRIATIEPIEQPTPCLAPEVSNGNHTL